MIRVREYMFDPFETDVETYIHPEEIYLIQDATQTVHRAAIPHEIKKQLTKIKMKNGDVLIVVESPRRIAKISNGVITLNW